MAITKRPNGSWLVSIYQPDKPRVRKTFKTRDEARKYEVITKAELAQGKTFYTKKEDPGNELFSNFLSKWHHGKESSVSEGTFNLQTILNSAVNI